MTSPQQADWPVEQCRTCAAPVIWAVTTTGKSMPVDRDITAEGNVALEWRAGKPFARVLNAAQRFGLKSLRASHFVTCVQADKWRRRGAKRVAS